MPALDSLYGMAFWPGVRQVMSCTYTCSRGITPGTAILTIAPTDIGNIAEVGDLLITDGARSFVLADCHIVEPSYSAGAGGQVMRLVIEDHRWRWRLRSLIAGHYNILEERYFDIPQIQASSWQAIRGNEPHPPYIPPGEEPIRKETKKTAPELCRLLLDALGEPDAVITGIDPKATPAVNWDATPPAQALQALVEQFGCDIVYQCVSGQILIAKTGEGGPLPSGQLLEEAPSLSVKARPEKITLYGAPARFQWRFKLEAVGIDFDGTFLPIDKLSYKPTDGWTASTGPPEWPMLPGPLTFGGTDTQGRGNLPGKRTYYDAKAAAQHSVYRMYRITLKDVATNGPLVIRPPRGHGPEIKIKDRRQVRLLPVKNDSTKDDVGRVVQWPATCYGRHTPPQVIRVGKDWLALFKDTDATTEVKVPFSIDQEHQVIVFSQPVLARKPDGKVYPAEIVLETACEVLDPVTWAPFRYAKSITVQDGLPGTEAAIVRDDVRYEVVMQYKSVQVFKPDGSFDHWDTRTVGAIDNANQIALRADYYLVGESLRYLTAGAERRKYVGIQLIDPDGAIQQVTWSIGGTDLSTTASLGTEHNLYVPPFAERRRTEVVDLRVRPAVGTPETSPEAERGQNNAVFPVRGS